MCEADLCLRQHPPHALLPKSGFADRHPDRARSNLNTQKEHFLFGRVPYLPLSPQASFHVSPGGTGSSPYLCPPVYFILYPARLCLSGHFHTQVGAVGLGLRARP